MKICNSGLSLYMFENQLYCKKQENIANVNLNTLSINGSNIIAISERNNSIEYHDEWTHVTFFAAFFFIYLLEAKNAFDR